MATQKEQAQIDVIINGQKATATISEMEKAVKVLNVQINNLQPGTEAFIKKTEELQKVKGKLTDVKKSVAGVSDETKNMIGEMAKLGPAGNMINMLTGGSKNLLGSVGTLTKGFMTLTGAIAGTGIGLLLIAFTALITYFKGSEEGGDRLAKVMAVVQAIFGQVIKVVSAVGGALFDAGEAIFNFIGGAEEAKTGTDEYAKSVTQLASEVADLQDHISALTIDIGRQNDELQTGIESNLRALKNRNISLQESEKIIKEVGEAEKKKLENSNNLTNQQIQSERKQFLLATENTKVKGDLFDKYINGQITGEQLLNSAKGTFKEEDLKRIADVLKQKEAAKREEANLGEKLNNLEDAAFAKDQARRDKEEAERKKASDKREKDAKDLADKIRRSESALAEYNILIAKNSDEAILKAKMDKIDLERDHALQSANLTKNEIALIKQKAIDDKNKLQEEVDKNLSEATKKRELEASDLKILLAQGDDAKILQAQLERIDLAAKHELEVKGLTQTQIDIINQKAINDKQKLQEESDKKLADAAKKSDLAAADLKILNAKGSADKILEAKKAKIDLERDYAVQAEGLSENEIAVINKNADDAKEQLDDQARAAKIEKDKAAAAEVGQALMQDLQAVADFGKIASDKKLKETDNAKKFAIKKYDEQLKAHKISKDTYDKLVAKAETDADARTREIKNKQAQADRKWAIAQAIMNLALSVIKALPNYPLAIITGIIGGLNLAKVIATPAATFRWGGVVSAFKKMFNLGGISKGSKHGSKYGESGIALVDRATGFETGEMQGNEIILTEGVTNNPRLRAEASRLNVLGGGRSFDTGGPLATGAATAAAANSSPAAVTSGADPLLAKMEELLVAFKAFPTKFKGFIVYQDIKDAETTVNEIKDESKNG